MKTQEIFFHQSQENKLKRKNKSPTLWNTQKVQVQNVDLNSLPVVLKHWIFDSDNQLQKDYTHKMGRKVHIGFIHQYVKYGIKSLS